MPVEILLILLAWAAIISLLVVVPWAVVRLVVKVLEADVNKPWADRYYARPNQSPDADGVNELPHELDEPVDPGDPVHPPTSSDADAESADRRHPE
jgi:hypothetical protein